MGVTGGLIALAAALAVATAAGVVLRRRAGRFRAGPARGAAVADAGRSVLTEADLGSRLGEQATLVQFSTEFCAPCRPTRRILADVADMVDGVTHVDIDAEANLGLVRRLAIHSTPTVLVLGADGTIVRRGTGQPRKADVIAALGAAISGAAASGAPASGAAPARGGRSQPRWHRDRPER